MTITAEVVEQNGVAQTIAPHGGRLINRLVGGAEAEELHRRAQDLPALRLTTRQLSDLELIAIGAFSPLDGFMRQADYERVVDELRLANGLPWSIPVTLAVDPDEAAAVGTEVALYNPQGRLRGTLHVQEVYGYDKVREAREVYRTDEEGHPGVAAVYAQGARLVAGPVSELPPPEFSRPEVARVLVEAMRSAD